LPQIPTRKLLQWPSNGPAAGQLVLWRKQFDCAIRIIGSS
jgi:hypothetical protein